MQSEIRWKKRRRVAPLLSAVLPGLGQAFTARWGPALAFFLLAAAPVFFLSFIWRDLNGVGYFSWRAFNFGHWIMFVLLVVTWVVNVIDAARGHRPATAPCIEACPAHIQIPSYINLILEKRYQECHALLTRWIPLVGTIGHVCHHPCERDCTRYAFDQPVAICPLKAFVGSYMIRNNLLGQIPRPTRSPRASRVAIIGSGPAGLTAAFFLARLGLAPTIFESLPVAGGMLAVGIPAYRLPRAVLQAEIDFILGQGVELKTGTTVGREVMIEDLFAQGFQAVLAAPGTHRESSLRVTGEELEGVVPGLAFLGSVNLGHRSALEGDVVVVGGGNVAMDAARCALRLGAATVTVVYRRSRLEMPANEWEVTEAEEERVKFLFLTNPVRVLGESRVEAVECLAMKLGEPDASGRRRPIPVEGSEFTIPCRWVIPAIGLVPGTSFLESAGVKLNSGGLVLTRQGKLATARRGLFAGGDAVLGPTSVIRASTHGREAAMEIFRHLSGRGAFRFPRIKVGPPQSEFATRPRVPQAAREVEERRADFNLIHQVYDEDPCHSEGRRCLRCDLNM